MARFCTEQLKVMPTLKFIEYQRSKGYYIFLHQGIRAAESYNRSKMKRNVYDNSLYKCTIKRPIFHWSDDEVFWIHKVFNQEPNPLYKMGMKRVGCFPCIMVSMPELKNIFTQFLNVKDQLIELEQKLGRTFFPPNYLPDRYCSVSAEVEEPVYRYIEEPPIFEEYDPVYYDRPENKEIIGYKNVIKKVPSVEDVYKYVLDDPDQLVMLHKTEGASCMSYYSICE